MLRKSYPFVVLRSPPPRYAPSAEDTKSAATQPPLYPRRGKRSRVGGYAAGAASQQRVSFAAEPRVEL